MIYDFHRIDEELVCPGAGAARRVCTCEHNPNSCPALLHHEDGILFRCEFEPGHDDPDWHESGD